MVAHAGLGEQLVANEQIALVDGALVGREGRIEHGEVRAQRVQERIGHRPDVALVGGIERGAVLEIVLTGAAAAQPVERGERQLHRFLRRVAARLEGDDDAIGLRHFEARTGHAQQLDGAHASLHQSVGEVGGAGKIVCDAAEQKAHSGTLSSDLRIAAACSAGERGLRIVPGSTGSKDGADYTRSPRLRGSGSLIPSPPRPLAPAFHFQCGGQVFWK